MDALERGLKQVTSFLQRERIPYMFIGGIANLIWGEPRLTQDLDVTILCQEAKIPELITKLMNDFSILPTDPLAFIQQTGVLPMVAREGVRIDLIFARLPYEEQAISRAKIVKLGQQQLKVCTAEDLIIHKIISERSRDLDDVQQIIIRQRDNLDRNYLDPLVHNLSQLLERPGIWAFYLKCLSR
ncbi:nucleotidyltransferase [Moorella naiadis]|uniref:nucleotidyltransferase n=1 Tax=Moorella naiadis (nom. illeg.) TaxID=3093670 RepID=UPI003D9CBA36